MTIFSRQQIFKITGETTQHFFLFINKYGQKPVVLPQLRLRPVTKPAEKPQVLAAARIMLTRISRSLVNKRQSLNGHRQSRTGFWIEVAW